MHNKQHPATRLIAASITAVMLAVALSACSKPDPNIEFMAYDEAYDSKPFFARVDHRYPLTDTVEARQQLAIVTPEYLASLDQEQVDQIYARLTAGPIPDGAYEGDLFFAKGGSGKLRAAEIVGGLKGLAVRVKGKKLETLGKVLWKGKVFYRDEGVLRNRIEDLAILAPVIDDPLNVPKIDVDHQDAWLLFPARLYCGQSLLDGRRESLIIDYAFSDDISGYREKPDYLASRRGFQVRDEIRMVRPGFYLGRAYLGRAFALNFTLYNEQVANAALDDWVQTGNTAEDCWIGNRRLAAAGMPRQEL
jgi:hypothetical protein